MSRAPLGENQYLRGGDFNLWGKSCAREGKNHDPWSKNHDPWSRSNDCSNIGLTIEIIVCTYRVVI